MAVYRTAQGRMLDMGKIMTQNERVRAVGNGKMNARGDTIDAQGRVVVPVSQKVSEAYAKTVVNTTAVELKTPEPEAAKKGKAKEQEIPITELTDFEQQLNQEMADEFDIEAMKKTEETKRGKK